MLIATGLLFASTANASKQVVDYFGTASESGSLGGEFRDPTGIAVNQTGAGPADPGDLYVVDPGNSRIQRFSRDTNGTPAEPYDDTYQFISAWGTDVVSPGGLGDQGAAAAANYEICTVAAQCKAGIASGGNGSAAGNGSLDRPLGIAIDEDTGDVYVTDGGNNRVSVYTGDGAFLRSFGYDVVASGPGDLPGVDEQQQLTVNADGGKFSLVFEGETTGAESGASAGNTQPGSSVAKEINSRSLVPPQTGAWQVGMGFSDDKGYWPPGTTVTAFDANSITLSQPNTASEQFPSFFTAFGHDLNHDATAAELEAALNGLPTIGGAGGSVTVSRTELGPSEFQYAVEFGGALAGEDQPLIVARGDNLTLASGTPSATVAETVGGGVYEVCVAAAGDVCRAGSPSAGAGAIGARSDIAVSQPDGEPATGTVFIADARNHRVGTYALDGTSPSSFGSTRFEQHGGFFDSAPLSQPTAIAVDSRGIVYAARDGHSDPQVERYDTENANGSGIGFLNPIQAPVNETQFLLMGASAGQFRLSLDPDGAGPEPPQTTTDLPYDADAGEVDSALEALPALGAGNISVTTTNFTGDKRPMLNIGFTGALALTDVEELVVTNGTTPFTGTITLVPARDGHDGPLSTGDISDLTLDPDSDGPGPDSDVLYVLNTAIQQFGPTNAPGLTAPPSAFDDTHATDPGLNFVGGLTVDSSDARLYATSSGVSGFPEAHGVYVIDAAGPAPTASLDSLSNITSTSVTANVTIDPNGPPLLSYQLEYSTDGSNWTSTPSVPLGVQPDPQSFSILLDPPGGGLQPATHYHLRLSAAKKFATPTITAALQFDTLAAPPQVETTGSPVPSPTSAVLSGRVGPRNSATTYRFQYGSAGPCSVPANPCTETQPRPAGSDDEIQLVAERLTGLAPDTTYHYRLLADNGAPSSPSAGADMTLTTHPAAPLSHGRYPGPPGSDRAYEQVSIPDSGGNPASFALGFSEAGDRAVYQVAGGTPISGSGTFLSQLLAVRPPGEHPDQGWRQVNITPRSIFEPTAPDWLFFPSADFTSFAGYNMNLLVVSPGQRQNLWRLEPGGAPPLQLATTLAENSSGFFEASADLSRVVFVVEASLDPAHPADPSRYHLYDVSDGTPELIGLLPDGAVPACGVSSLDPINGTGDGAFSFLGVDMGARRWLSADGERMIFPSGCGSVQLYLRELDAAQTELISGPALSGNECPAAFIRATADAAFFWTQSRLAPEDSPCSGKSGDVYRYDFATGDRQCLTCVAGPEADVRTDIGDRERGAPGDVGVSDDGSAVYFVSPNRLLPGAAAPGTYRVDVAAGTLAYVAPGDQPAGHALASPSAVSADGQVLVFRSQDPRLEPLGSGTDNGGTYQYYRYDHTDRSLVCVSCPPDGSAPRAEVMGLPDFAPGAISGSTTFNGFPLSADGSVFAFDTPSQLVNADQNTTPAGKNPHFGQDVYEWRGGRALLITDGLSSWSEPDKEETDLYPRGLAPEPAGVSPSGRDLFFFASAPLTPDAPDAYRRLYDARIGGGIDFAVPDPPCPLEVCQGIPEGVPEEQPPGTSNFRGPGNPPTEGKGKKCPKGKRKVRRQGKVRCVKKQRSAKRHHGRRGAAEQGRRAQ